MRLAEAGRSGGWIGRMVCFEEDMLNWVCFGWYEVLRLYWKACVIFWGT